MSELRAVLTCAACPQQYDVFLGDEEVAYMRFRHGYFSVEVPFGGAIVYSWHSGDEWQGCGLPDDQYDAGMAAVAEALR